MPLLPLLPRKRKPNMRLAEFFGYAMEREQIRLRKEADLPYPWTEDEILLKYKFTNIRRENDRTSRAFINDFYRPHRDDDMESILLNCAIRRYFGTEEFSRTLGWIDYDSFSADSLEEVARDSRQRGERVFTGAYVITNGGVSAPKEYVVAHHYIKPLHAAIPELVKVAQKTASWQRLADEMRKIDGFGGSGFMTKESLVDTTYTNFWDRRYPTEVTMSVPSWDWFRWTPIGPGARRGITRLLGHDDPDGYDAKKLQNNEKFCMETITKIGLAQGDFWTHGELCPHDIQFTLCEFDKYERVRLGQGRPRSGYKVKK